jgi:hypothetical protein
MRCAAGCSKGPCAEEASPISQQGCYSSCVLQCVPECLQRAARYR